MGILIICEMSASEIERERERERRLVGWIGCEKCHLVESGIVVCMYVCMYFIWRNPLRLHIIIKHIKTGISGFKPRITQKSITILISTVVL